MTGQLVQSNRLQALAVLKYTVGRRVEDKVERGCTSKRNVS